MGASQNDVQSALQEALDNQSSGQDPDVIPAGGQQATTTDEAKKRARQLLDRVGSTDVETEKLKRALENNAEASRQALRRAQDMLVQHREYFFPSDQEKMLQQSAAMLAPHPNVPQTGAVAAEMGNLYATQAEQQKAEREAGKEWLLQESDLPYAERVAKINEALAASKGKILEMQTKYNADLAKPAMTALGRMSVSPANQKGIIPNSSFGKIALDQLGPRAYNNPADPTSGFSDDYRALVKKLNDTAIAQAQARAGVDTTPYEPEEKVQAANLAGVPADASQYGLPDVSHMSTKLRQNYLQNEQKAIEKAQEGYGAADEQTRSALRNLDEFQKLNAVTYTGKTLEPWYLGGVHAGPHGVGADFTQEHGGFNLNPYAFAAGFKTNIQTMQKDAANVVAQAIPAKGFGRVTNRDLNLFQSGSIGIDKNKDTNDHVAQALRIRLNNDLDRNMFMQSYAGIHGSLRGSEGAWNDYLNHNPIFDPTFNEKDPKNASVLPPLNPHRMPWQDYFRQKNGPLESAPVETLDTHQSKLTSKDLHGADPNDPALVGLSDQEKIAATTPAQAEGGRVGMADGGQPEPEGESPSNALNALIHGLSFKFAGSPEDTNSPVENFGGELIGGTGATALALAALRNKTARRLMAEHPNLTASGVGAVTGGIAGEEGSDSPFAGALSGSVMGPIAAGLTRGTSSKLMQLADRLGGIENTPGVRRSLNAINLDTNFDDLSSQMARDKALGVNPTIAEAAGPRSTGLLGAAMRRDTPEGSELLGSLQERQAQSGVRAGEAVNKAMAPDDYRQKTAQLRDNLYTKAKPLYEQAYTQFPSVKTQALQGIMATPSGQEASMRAFKMMQDMQIPIGAPDATGMVQNPSLQYLDQVKRSLDDMIMSEEGTGPSYQSTNQGRVLRDMRSKLVDELDKATMGPQGQPSPYRAARDQYAGDLDIMDALRSGHDNFKAMTPDDVRGLMGKLDWSARDAYRTGVASSILQNIGSMGGNRNAARAVIANPNLQEKIMAIFDKPEQGQRFLDALTREAETYQTGKGLVSAGEKGLFLSVAPTSIPQMLRQQLMRKGTAGEIADTLGTQAQDPDVKEKIARLRGIADRLRTQKDFSRSLGAATAGGTVTAFTPTMQQGQ